MRFADLKTGILAKRPVCEICRRRPAVDLHHCLVHDSKRLHDLVTVVENLMPVCRECHTMYANGKEVRRQFAREQIQRGYDIKSWYSKLPLKIKERWLLEIEKEQRQ